MRFKLKMSSLVKKIKNIKLLSIQCTIANENVPTPKNTPPSIERRVKKNTKNKLTKKLFE